MAEVDRSDKITVSIGPVDLGQIDLLVAEGFFAERTDFIRTAIRRRLDARSSAVDETVARRKRTLGPLNHSRRDLDRLRDAGRTVELRVLGLATIAEDVTPSSRSPRSPRSRSSVPSAHPARTRQHSPLRAT